MTTPDAPRSAEADTKRREDAAAAPVPTAQSLPRLLPVLEALSREITQREAGEGLPAGADESPIGVALCTLEGRFIEVNEALVGLSGYTGFAYEATL
jgi:PAS domain-containing protein